MSPSELDRSDSGLEMPLRPALVKSDTADEPLSPRTGPVKVVSIADPEVSPVIPSLEHQHGLKRFSAGVAKRLSGRPASTSSRSSLNMEELPGPAIGSESGKQDDGTHEHSKHSHDRLISQVSEWLQAEKAKRAARKSKNQSRTNLADRTQDEPTQRLRSSSQSSDGSAISLEKLQRILEDNMSSSAFGFDGLGQFQGSSPRLAPNRSSVSMPSRRKSSILGRAQSSDTEFYDGDVVVPSCDVILDNSKTLSYSGGGAASSSNLDLTKFPSRADKEKKGWSVFKTEILKLAHTLRLKGWRRVPLDCGDDIQVKRLSGALTNAVYVVSPPPNLPSYQASTSGTSTPAGTSTPSQSKRKPPKLLLRIYGPQVEHLIDRENELGILRRLARKKIGPRLLGTFKNGRFEEFFESTTLTSQDLKVPETSKQIAKRMRELHEGVDLLEREREDGAFVWRNWDKWVERCEQVVAFVDAKSKVTGSHVCGVEWKIFKEMVEKYRAWLAESYGGERKMAEKLVFAHNDTQYGNILRLLPLTSESPLLLPANTHKQLVVIDFEYASANTPGLEFANHFTEWCYNYHDEKAPHACHTERYPTLEEQRRFIRSYVNHRPQFNARASATPKFGPRADSTVGSIKEFMLDSRTPGGAAAGGYDLEEERRIKAAEAEVERLCKEARIWRVANSAQWVAWGIVQAQVPELDGNAETAASQGEEAKEGASDRLVNDHPDKRPEGLVAESLMHGHSSQADIKAAETAEQQDGDDEFDYLGYARERALFFWGDCVALGLCKLEDLPADVRDTIKIVEY